MELTVGAVLEGKVKTITNFGAFVTLGDNKTGMVHISEVANTYVSDTTERSICPSSVWRPSLSVSLPPDRAATISETMPPAGKTTHPPRHGLSVPLPRLLPLPRLRISCLKSA